MDGSTQLAHSLHGSVPLSNLTPPYMHTTEKMFMKFNTRHISPLVFSYCMSKGPHPCLISACAP